MNSVSRLPPSILTTAEASSTDEMRILILRRKSAGKGMGQGARSARSLRLKALAWWNERTNGFKSVLGTGATFEIDPSPLKNKLNACNVFHILLHGTNPSVTHLNANNTTVVYLHTTTSTSMWISYLKTDSKENNGKIIISHSHNTRFATTGFFFVVKKRIDLFNVLFPLIGFCCTTKSFQKRKDGTFL